MSEKLKTFSNDPLWTGATPDIKRFISVKAGEYRLTSQQIRNLLMMQRDFEMWGEKNVSEVWRDVDRQKYKGKSASVQALASVGKVWDDLKKRLSVYSGVPKPIEKIPLIYKLKDDNGPILGRCPVASNKTRCCNLYTLDAVTNCGFDCSYCSIRTFYSKGAVFFDANLEEKLNNLKLGPSKTYHIGTGQSSDSLMWGNRSGLLDKLFAFAEKNGNVILELKTKSANIDYLLKNKIPRNVITTWTLNTPAIIKHEEWGTASLDRRLGAAAKIAAKGALVGFHFHPIVRYLGWKEDYGKVVERTIKEIPVENVCMVSLGVPTFIKSVIRDLRNNNIPTKILQMPLVEIAGKFSYPFKVKEELFSTVYGYFKPWHDKAYFYLCMEDPELWPLIFGRRYDNNNEFEEAMKVYYFDKISKYYCD